MAARARFRLRFAVVSWASLALLGCGPVNTTLVLADATVAIEAARAVEADRYAVFEYVSAVEYLKKAREKEGYSEFQAAMNLAEDARRFAEQARARALKAPNRGTGQPPPSVEGLDETPGDAL